MGVNYLVKGEHFEAGKPTACSNVPVNRSTSGPSGQDLAPDGKHFAVIRFAEDQSGAQAPVVFLLNFVDEIRRRISEKNAQ
jgi:hypothetical protein